MKVLIVGMNPAPSNPTNKARRNSTHDRLNAWMTAANVQHYSFFNTFDAPKNNPRVCDIESSRFKYIDDDYVVFALGNFVSVALTNANIEHVKLPHPSPRNRMFNDPNFEQTVIDTVKRRLS